MPELWFSAKSNRLLWVLRGAMRMSSDILWLEYSRLQAAVGLSYHIRPKNAVELCLLDKQIKRLRFLEKLLYGN